MPGRPRPLRLGSGHASSLAKIHTSGSEAEHVETEKTTYRQILCDATFPDIFYKPHQIQAVKMFRKSLLFASTRTGNAQSRSKLPLCLVSQFLFEVSQGGTLHCVHVKEVPRCHKMRTITSNTSRKQSRKQHPDASTQKSRTSTFVWQVPTRTFASLKAWMQKDFLPC